MNKYHITFKNNATSIDRAIWFSNTSIDNLIKEFKYNIGRSDLKQVKALLSNEFKIGSNFSKAEYSIPDEYVRLALFEGHRFRLVNEINERIAQLEEIVLSGKDIDINTDDIEKEMFIRFIDNKSII